MEENIELHTFHNVNNGDSDVEEYVEIKPDKFYKEESPPQLQNKLTKEFNFFTKYNLSQKGDKKKRTKKKLRNSNIMDIIHSELNLIEHPISKNIVTLEDFSEEPRNMYARTENAKIRFSYHWQRDAETGQEKQMMPLNPTFPKIFTAASDHIALPVQYMPAARFGQFLNTYEEIQDQGIKFLDIELSSLYFKNHHTLSLEELLIEKLLDIHREYNNIRNNLKDLGKDIKVNRDTKNSYKEELEKILYKKEDVIFDPTLGKYTERMLFLKSKYIDTEKDKRVTFNKLVSIWSDIEVIRTKNGYRSSKYDLEISKIVLSLDDYENEWNKIYSIEFSDFLDKIEFDYVNKYTEYKQQKYQNKENRCKTKNVSKPKLNINEKEIKEEVQNIVDFLVDKEIYDVKIKYIDEHSRRTKSKTQIKKDMNENLIVLKIYIDDMYVCETGVYNIPNNCNINIEDFFSIQVMPNNKTIGFKIYENDIEQSVHIIEILNIGRNCVKDKVNISFVYDLKLTPNNKVIGSGNNIKEIAAASNLRLKSSNIFNGIISTICDAEIIIGWSKDTCQNNPEQIKNYFTISHKIKQLINCKGQAPVLKEVIESVYNTDISENENLLQKLNSLVYKEDRTCETGTFELEEDSVDMLRFKLIQLRTMGELCDLEKQLVPLYSNQISTDQLNLLQKNKEHELSIQYLNGERCTEMDPTEMQRYIGSKYMQNLNKNMLKKFNENLMRNSYNDIVFDFKDLNLMDLFRTDVQFTPKSIFPNGVKQEWLSGNNRFVEIYVTVMRAFNLPDRATSTISNDDDEHDDNIAGFKVKPLRPFVKINCQEECTQSATGIGCHPTWNQTFRFKVEAGSPSLLEVNIYDEFKINISDDYIEEDMSLQSKTVHYRFYNKWLGSVRIPLYSVFSLGKLKGMFKLNMPPFVLGYENSKSPTPHLQKHVAKNDIAFISLQITTNLSNFIGLSHRQPIPEDDIIMKHLNEFISSYEIAFPFRNLSLTYIDSNGLIKCVTQFLHPIPPPNTERFPKFVKGRIESAISKSSGVSKSSSTKSYESKKNDSVTPRSNEKESLYSGFHGRFNKKPNEMEKMISNLARYVALIPNYEVSKQYNVTLTGMELLKILNGSPLDHTLLLAGYFMYLGIKPWVIIGTGLPRGLSSYVLVKYDEKTNRLCLINEYFNEKKVGLFGRHTGVGQNWVLFDATSGERHDLRDVSCPLKTVKYVYDDDNIWVNMQSSQECESVSFDFSKTSDWQQVFNKNVFIMNVPQAITDANLYSSPIEVDTLRQKIEIKIKSKIQKWRPHLKTIWNRFIIVHTNKSIDLWTKGIENMYTHPTIRHFENKIKMAARIKTCDWVEILRYEKVTLYEFNHTVWCNFIDARYCSSLLREVLPQWEYWAFNSSEPKPGLSQKLKQLSATYNVFGFPLNFPYTSIKNAVAIVKSTGIYIYDDPTVEFGLGVELFSYPNSVISVWIFLVSIAKV